MQSSFIVVHNQQEVGPLTEMEVRERLTRGDLLPIDYYYDEVLGDWALVETRFTPLVSVDSTQVTATDINLGSSPYPAPPEIPPPQEQVARRPSRSTTNSAQPLPPLEKGAPPPITVSTPSVISIPPTPKLENQDSPPPMKSSHETKPKDHPSPAVTPPLSPTPHAPLSLESESRTEKVEMVGGVTTVSLKQVRAGVVVVRLKESNDKSIRSSQPAKVEVKPGKVSSISWICQEEVKAGQLFSLIITCRDNYGNTSDQFNGEVELTLKGKHSRSEKIKIQNGQARFDTKWNQAEKIEIEMNDSSDSGIALPPNRIVLVKPGPVAQILMETPDQIEAGAPLPVTIKAVDEFGNVVPDYKGEIEIEVNESAPSKAG